MEIKKTSFKTGCITVNAINLYIQAHGGLVPAAKAISAATGNNYRGSRLGEWRDGKLPVPDAVHRAMLPIILPAALKAVGVTVKADQIQPLADSIMPPKTNILLKRKILLTGEPTC